MKFTENSPPSRLDYRPAPPWVWLATIAVLGGVVILWAAFGRLLGLPMLP
jgi:hypothetical protein